MNFDSANWLAYREANMRFADVVAGMVQAGDMVWVQDYHLMLLPMLLRSIISGESAQGEMVRRELGRVKQGVDDDVVKDILGLQSGVADSSTTDYPQDQQQEVLHDVAEEESVSPTKKNGDSTPLPRPEEYIEAGANPSGVGTVKEDDVLEMKPPTNTNPTAHPTTPSAAARRRPMFARGMSQFQKQEAAAKERGKEGVRIGFFLHTPFPSSEIYR